MELHSRVARDEGVDAFSLVQSLYPQQNISDALLWDFSEKSYLGFASLTKPAPILKELLREEDFVEFVDKHLHPNSCLLFSATEVYLNQEKIVYPASLQKKIQASVKRIASFGGTLASDGSHRIDLLSPAVGPHYGVNLLLGWREGFADPLLSTPKSVVDEFGRGSFRAKAAYQVLATRWDVRPEENGNPFNRQFYVLENGKQIFYSANVQENVSEAFCIHYPSKTCIVYVLKDGLKIERTLFILAQKEGLPDATEVQVVTLASPSLRHLKIVFTGVFGFSNPGCQEVDIIYQTVIHQSEVISNEEGAVVALSPNYYPVYFNKSPRFVSLVSSEGYADSFSNDATSFLGHGSIEHPENLAHLDNAYKVKGASFFALGKTIEVSAGKPFSCATLTGMVDAEEAPDKEAETILHTKLAHLLEQYPSAESLMEQLQKQDAFFKDYSSYFQIDSGEANEDAMMNHNIPFQTLYQSFVSRAFAQTQKGYREIGFREVQDLYASIPYLVNSHREALASELLSKWIENVYTMGYANHNFFVVGKEPGMCSDDQLWLIPAVEQYIESTGDISYLDKEFPTADGGRRSLVDTIKAILTYSSKISIGKHGLPLLDKADWNDCLKIDVDCLDGPTKEKLYQEQLKKNHQEYGVPFENDLSESVMNAFLLVYALNEAIELAKRGKKDALLRMAEAYRDELSEAIRKSCFINGYYARVLINREKPQNGIRFVGAPGDSLSTVKSLQNGSLYLNSFSWSLLSGVASEDEIAQMLKLVDAYLKTSSGYRLCSEEDLTLTGAKQAATSHYFPGDRENGGVFKHATMMFTRALLLAAKRPYQDTLRKQMIEDAFFMLRLAYPYHCHENPYVYKGNPRFCTQYNNPITQENFGPILSGTATWLTLSFWEEAGFHFTEQGLTLHPVLPLEADHLNYRVVHQNVVYEVAITKAKGSLGAKIESLQYDGVDKNPAEPLPILQNAPLHHIEIRLK